MSKKMRRRRRDCRTTYAPWCGPSPTMLPPRCPGCGVIVGEDRQFCLSCWTSLDFLDGPACLHCSVPLPRALPAGPIACGACLAAAPPFEGALAAATPHDHRLLLRVKSTASLRGKKRRERERGFRRLCAGARFPDARVGSSFGADRRRSRQLRDFARGGAGVAAQRSETGVGSHVGGRSSRRADDKQHI